MITHLHKEECSGCEACAQICPRHCISMATDEDGFVYPKTDSTECSNCGLCEKICPIINLNTEREPIKVYAGKNEDDSIRLKSSSGGIFHVLASMIIKEGGAVFGAKFNENWEVIHDYTDTIEGIQPFLGSKYVQSRIKNCYNVVEQFLRSSRKVLFSGTPCQIAGLKNYLRKKYSNLITIDIVCHGVPSPLIWQSYLQQQSSQKPIYVSFRDKSTGWDSYSLCIKTLQKTIKRKAVDDNYMRCFIGNLSLRPSCYECKFKCGRSHSDITLGDYWGIKQITPQLNDNIGTSLILANTLTGLELINSLNIHFEQIPYNKVIKYNPSIVKSSPLNDTLRLDFWQDFHTKGAKAIHKYGKKFAPSLILRIKITIAKLLKRCK